MTVTRTDRRRLEAIVADRSAPQKHVWRAHIILATAEGCGTAEIMRRSGKSKPVVWRWQARFMAEASRMRCTERRLTPAQARQATRCTTVELASGGQIEAAIVVDLPGLRATIGIDEGNDITGREPNSDITGRARFRL